MNFIRCLHHLHASQLGFSNYKEKNEFPRESQVFNTVLGQDKRVMGVVSGTIKTYKYIIF